jgi:hypothetical protein
MFDYQQISIIETASLMYTIMRLNAIVKKDSNEDSMKTLIAIIDLVVFSIFCILREIQISGNLSIKKLKQTKT